MTKKLAKFLKFMKSPFVRLAKTVRKQFAKSLKQETAVATSLYGQERPRSVEVICSSNIRVVFRNSSRSTEEAPILLEDSISLDSNNNHCGIVNDNPVKRCEISAEISNDDLGNIGTRMLELETFHSIFQEVVEERVFKVSKAENHDGGLILSSPTLLSRKLKIYQLPLLGNFADEDNELIHETIKVENDFVILKQVKYKYSLRHMKVFVSND